MDDNDEVQHDHEDDLDDLAITRRFREMHRCFSAYLRDLADGTEELEPLSLKIAADLLDEAANQFCSDIPDSELYEGIEQDADGSP